jgi:hypothetical protein
MIKRKPNPKTKASLKDIKDVFHLLDNKGIKLISDSEYDVFRIYPVGDKDSTYETNGRSDEDLTDALGSGLDMAKRLGKRQNPKSKVAKKKVKKVAKKSTKKFKKTKRIIREKRPTYRRIAGENAAGGLGTGFGFAAGHSFGDWLFD